MLGKIIVPLDGSPLSERALPHAEALAHLSGARIVPVHAVESRRLRMLEWVHAEDERVYDAQKYLDGVTYELSVHEVPNEPGIAQTAPSGMDAADWILEQVHVQGADLIVMTTNGRSGLSGLVYGSTAEKVLAGSPVPVLLVRAWEHEPAPLCEHPRLLTPLDGSTLAEEALWPARMLAEDLRGDISVVHVLATPEPVLSPRIGSAEQLAHRHQESADEMKRYLEGIAAKLRSDGATVSVDLREGDPAAAIVTARRDFGATLVVMATRGRTGLKRAVLGSVSMEVLQKDTIPLLLIGPQVDEETRNETDASTRRGRALDDGAQGPVTS